MAQANSKPISFPSLTSQIASAHDAFANKPQYLLSLYKGKGEQGLQFYKYLLSQTAETSVSGEEFSHWEEDVYTKAVTAGATVGAPGAGANITLTLSANDVSADNYSYPREDTRLENLNNGAQYVVTTKVSATTLTLSPVLGTTNYGITTGDVFAVLDTAYGEETDQPDTAFSFQTKYDFNMQILKETVSMSGTEKTNQKWFTQYDTGTSFEGYWTPMMMQAEYRMAQQEYNACFWSTPGDNAGAQTMNGLIYEMDEDGGNRSFNLPVTATLDLAALETINESLIGEFYVGPLYSWLSLTRYQQVNSELNTEFADVNIARVNKELQSFFWDGIEGEARETLMATMDYKGVTQSGRTYAFQSCWAFNDPAQGRLSNARSQNFGLFLPIGGDTNPQGFMQKYVNLRYKKLGDYSRRREVWRDGTAHQGLKFGQTDWSRMYIRCHIGLETFMLNRAALLGGVES